MDQKKNPILLADDNLSDAKLTIRALIKANVVNDIVHVKDGEEALDFIFAKNKFESRNVEDLPALILLDLKMPKVNGIEVLQKIRNDERTKLIPVVVFTSSQETPDVKECYRLGVNSYIVKPLDFDQFSKIVVETGLYWILINHPPE
jgi:two-component system, response regulator